MPLPLVISTHELTASDYASLEGLCELLQPDPGQSFSKADLLAMDKDPHALITPCLEIGQEILDHFPNVKIVANIALGTDNLDLELMQERGIWASHVEAFVEASADFTLALMLSLARRIPELDRTIRRGAWQELLWGPYDGISLRDKTLGILGYGRIGKAVAERAKVFGMRILWHNRTPSPDPAYRDLKPLLVQSDILSIHTPLNKQSHKLINAKKLALMRPNALLINMARGAVIDEAALVDALKSGIISGAALDVFEDEPQIHPGLLELENVILTPHAGGGARECRSRAREEACENVAAVLQGNSPLQPIFYLS